MTNQLPAEQTADNFTQLQVLRDTTQDQDAKRLIRWALRKLESREPDELKQLEIRTAKYDYYAKLAKTFSSSKMVDSNMGEADLFYVIEMGDSVGLSAPQAIQSIASINGKPALWGDGLLAVVRNSRDCESIREEQTGTIEGGDAVAVCITKRRGEDEVARAFSLEDATRAGLYPPVDRNGNPSPQSPWAKYPMRMLQMRARAWALRDVYADVLRGFSSAEELQDIEYAHIIDDDAGGTPEIITPDDVAGEAIEAVSDEKPAGNIGDAIKALEEASTMPELITTKDSIREWAWTDEEQDQLNDTYRLARRALKEDDE